VHVYAQGVDAIMPVMQRAIRGSGIPETAITISTGLLFMFALIRIALVGYLQLSSDGAAYLAAHEYTLQQLYSSQINPQQVTSNVFPTIPQADVITSSSPAPPTVTLPGIANYYSTFSQTARQGGITGVRPAQTLALVTPPPAATLNVIGGTTAVNVSASAIEPLMQTMNTHYNTAGTSLNSNTASNYFSTNSKENMPPYFAGFNMMAHCTDTSATCRSDGNQALYQLGTAAFLHSQNWNNTMQDETESTGVFCDVYWHQQYYTGTVSPIFPATYPNISASTATANLYKITSTTSPLYLMYNTWDVPPTGATSIITRPNATATGTECQN
jgi:hypothetical protein